MKKNAITMKDMQTASRSNKTLIGLIFIVGAMAAVSIVVYAVMNYIYTTEDYSSMSLSTFITVFSVMSYVIFFIYNLIIPSITGSAVSAEREKQTLEILLTTRLSSFQVVWGKMKAIMYKMTIYYVVMFPIIGIVMTVGGVRFTDILLVYVTIIAMTFMLGSAGMWISCVAKKTTISIIISYFVCLFVEVGPFITTMWITNAQVSQAYLKNQTPVISVELLLLLLITPISTIRVAMTNIVGGSADLRTLIFDSYYFDTGNINHPRVFEFLLNHWVILSIGVQIVIGFFFLFLAAKFLNPVLSANVKKKGRNKTANIQTSRARRNKNTTDSGETEEITSEEVTDSVETISDNTETTEETV
ncbi:MAG: ABC transporter permease [Lachnospiraceae bacterium]|nr:ABC transporter permease [Lachnospiraceae bacterium]